MKIGVRDVVHTATLIIPGGEDAWVSFELGSWHVKLNIVFLSSKKEDKSAIAIETVEDYAKLLLTNWDNSIGTATLKPLGLATTSDGKRLSLMISHILIGKTNKLDLQFMLGGEE